jgi:hypothetical protein
LNYFWRNKVVLQILFFFWTIVLQVIYWSQAQERAKKEKLKKRKNANMKTNETPTENYANNITAIHADGTPVSCQVWKGGVKHAAELLLEWYEKGEASKGQVRPWDRPIIHAYIINMGDNAELYFYDMTNPAHVSTLRSLTLRT